MNFQDKGKDSDTGASLFSAPEKLNIYECQSVRDDVLALIDEHSNLAIDLSEIVEADTSGMQILLAARQEADAKGRTIAYRSPSDAVTELVELYNLGAPLGFAEEGSAD